MAQCEHGRCRKEIHRLKESKNKFLYIFVQGNLGCERIQKIRIGHSSQQAQVKCDVEKFDIFHTLFINLKCGHEKCH